MRKRGTERGALTVIECLKYIESLFKESAREEKGDGERGGMGELLSGTATHFLREGEQSCKL